MVKKKLEKAQLLAAYDELDDIAGVEPPIKWKSQGQFEKELYETYDELVQEGDEFSEKTQSVFDQLIEKFGDGEPDEEPEEKPKEEPKEKAKKTPAKPKPEKKKEPKVEEVNEEVNEEKEPVPEPELPEMKIENRVDALCAALQLDPENADAWSRMTDIILKKQGGKIKPNPLANKFDMGYLYKIAKHFDLGELPK